MSIAPLDPAGVRFEDLPEQAWPRQEIIDGSLHVTPLASIPHQRIVMRLCAALLAVVPPELEVLPGANLLRRSTTDRLLIPDVVVADAGAAAGAGASLAPEAVYLAVEVISRSSRAMDLHLKKQLYAEWGIDSYWVLDPKSQQIHEFGRRASAGTWLAQTDLSGIWPA